MLKSTKNRLTCGFVFPAAIHLIEQLKLSSPAQVGERNGTGKLEALSCICIPFSPRRDMTAFMFSNNYFYQQKYIPSQCWRLFWDWKRQKNSTRKFQIKNVLWRNNPSSVKWERQRFVDCLKYQNVVQQEHNKCKLMAISQKESLFYKHSDCVDWVKWFLLSNWRHKMQVLWPSQTGSPSCYWLETFSLSGVKIQI